MSDRHFDLTPEQQQWWRDHMAEFARDVYAPFFQPHGFTMPEAFLAWKLTFLRADMDDLRQALLDDDPDRNAPWRTPPGEEESPT